MKIFWGIWVGIDYCNSIDQNQILNPEKRFVQDCLGDCMASWQSPGMGSKYGDGLVFVVKLWTTLSVSISKGQLSHMQDCDNVDLNIKSYFTNVKWDIAS